MLFTGAICRAKKVFFHTDAAQAVGKIPIDVNEMNLDLMSISGHKVYGPKGKWGVFFSYLIKSTSLSYVSDFILEQKYTFTAFPVGSYNTMNWFFSKVSDLNPRSFSHERPNIIPL